MEEWTKDSTDNIKRCCPNILFYSYHGNVIINKYLRNNRLPSDFVGVYNELMTAISTAEKLPESVIYRGVSNDLYKDVKVDDYIIDSGFMSFSFDEGIAHEFAHKNPGIGNVLVLTVNNEDDVRGAYISLADGTSYYEESEVILAPNTVLSVVGLYEDEDYNMRYIYVKAKTIVTPTIEFFDIRPQLSKIMNIIGKAAGTIMIGDTVVMQNDKIIAWRDYRRYLNGDIENSIISKNGDNIFFHIYKNMDEEIYYIDNFFSEIPKAEDGNIKISYLNKGVLIITKVPFHKIYNEYLRNKTLIGWFDRDNNYNQITYNQIT